MKNLCTLAITVISLTAVGKLQTQSLCRKVNQGVVRWFSGNSCPSGFSHVTNSVRASYLRTNSVTSSKIADGAVTSSKLASNSVTAGKIAAGAVTAGTISANAVTSAEIANDAVDTNEIKDGAVTNDKLAGNINWNKIDTSSIGSGAINHGTINFSGWTAPADSVKTVSIEDNSVINDKLAGGITEDKLVGNIPWSKINSGSIPANAIDHSKVNFSGWTAGTNTVPTNSLQAGAVTNSKLNIDTNQPLPYYTFLSTVDLTSTPSGYAAIAGIKQVPSPSSSGLGVNNVFNCSEGTFFVSLDDSPGAFEDRVFALYDISTPSPTQLASFSISGNNSSDSQSFSGLQPSARLVVSIDSTTFSPTPTFATIFLVCK